MSSEADDTPEGFEAWTVRVRKGEGPKLMEAVVSRAASAGVEVLVLDGSMVFGKDHLRSALQHAVRAAAQGTNTSDSRAMETLLYASGERQLSAAIKKMSVTDTTEEVVVAKLAEGAFAPEAGWAELSDRPLNPSKDRLRRFGISSEELETVSGEKASELVLEKVAAVEILKK